MAECTGQLRTSLLSDQLIPQTAGSWQNCSSKELCVCTNTTQPWQGHRIRGKIAIHVCTLWLCVPYVCLSQPVKYLLLWNGNTGVPPWQTYYSILFIYVCRNWLKEEFHLLIMRPHLIISEPNQNSTSRKRLKVITLRSFPTCQQNS